MLGEGRNFREIAGELGLSRSTVRRFARAASPEELLVNDGTGRQAGIPDEHEPYLRERWNAGCTNAAAAAPGAPRPADTPAARDTSGTTWRVSAQTRLPPVPFPQCRRSGL